MIRCLKSFTSLLKPVASRPITEYRDKNIWVPDSIEDVKEHMERTNPDIACVYFHASWNPFMKRINRTFERICVDNPQVHHIWIDCDKYPTLKFYYDTKVEPTFIILVNGAEIARVVGDDFERVLELYERYEFLLSARVAQLHYSEFKYIGSAKRVYEPFESFYLKARRWVDYASDPFTTYKDKND
eukprot:TRINITY_DN14860_c0_g2_i2.p1 TRINITY_DN14860_c0_g2~~TRINITY_DN14860_c0_g2_i2.p1  ORF type:complete len:186 (-),score=41.74 TRINITY_DN14860_c0_g2_i2:40-597(-)